MRFQEKARTMNIVEYFYSIYDIVANYENDKRTRIEAFHKLADFICSMQKPKPYIITMVNALLEEFESSTTSNEFVIMVMNEIANELCLKRVYSHVLLLSEENNVAFALRRSADSKIIMMPAWSFNAFWADSYDGILQCGKIPFEEVIISAVGNAKLIHAYNICLYQICTNPSAYFIQANYLKQIEYTDTLVTGMSYTRNAIRDEYLDKKVVSVANSSQDLYFDFKYFKDAISRSSKIKNVIIGLAPYSLRYDLSKTRLDYRIFYYQELFDDSHNNPEYKACLHEHHEQIKRLKKIFGEGIFDILFDTLADPLAIEGLERRTKIFVPAEITEPEVKEMVKKFDKPYYETITENKKILREYFDLALAHGISIYVFVPPYSQWYKEHWKKDYLDEVLDYVNELGKEYDFDLIDLSSFDLPDYYFGDYAHLNNLGAITVATVLNQILK